jgi:hypothetical protein
MSHFLGGPEFVILADAICNQATRYFEAHDGVLSFINRGFRPAVLPLHFIFPTIYLQISMERVIKLPSL